MELLGLIQQQIYTLNPEHDDSLPHLKLIPGTKGVEPSRKLCIGQFLEFKKIDGLELGDIRELISHNLLQPGKMSQMVTAYEHLCTGIINFLSSAEGTKIFLENKVGREKDMEILEYRLVASSQRQTEITKIHNLTALMKSNKFFGRMRGKQRNLQRIKQKGLENFAGHEILDPNVLSEKWVSHPEVHEMNRLIVQLAESGEAPTPDMMNNSTEHLILSESTKNGFRQQIFAVLEYGDFVTGSQSNYAAFPYSPLHRTNGVDPEKIKANLWKGPYGEVVYQRPDPYSPDPNDPMDPMAMEPEKWELMRGKLLTVDFHKTASEPQLIWLSQYGIFYFKCYESIRARYLESIGEDPGIIDRPFFINTKGGHFLGRGSNLDMTTFCRRVGIQFQTSHVCRKMMVRKVFNSNNAILKEYEQSALCHLPTTVEDHYLGQLSRQVKSLTVTAWFREQTNRNDEMVVNCTEIEDAWINNAQGERCLEGLKKMNDQELRFWLEGWERKDSMIEPIPQRHITPNVKVALIRLAKEATLKGYFVSNKGSPVSLLLDGRSVRTAEHTSLILRMLALLPQNWPSLQLLKKNLLVYAGFNAESGHPPRVLMVDWAGKFVDMIHKMRTKVTHIANPIICQELTDIAVALGGGYMFGNANVQRQLSYWIELANERTAKRTGNIMTVKPKRIFAQLEAGRKELEAQRRELGRNFSNQEDGNKEPERMLSNKDDEIEATTVTVGDIQIDVTVDEPVSIVITPRKPRRFATIWDDDLLFKLLSQYVEQCSNPMVPTSVSGRRPKMEKQCYQLRDNEVKVDGVFRKWKEIATVQYMGGRMYRHGFKSQTEGMRENPATGLHAIIEQVVGETGTSEIVRSKISEILEKAREYMD